MKRFINFLFFIVILATFVPPSYSFQKKDLIMAQISDLHFFITDDSINNYDKLIESINHDKQIDLVVFTGDNIDKPNLDLLGLFLMKTRKIKCPYYFQIGDNDCLKAVGIPKKNYMKYLNKISSHNYKSFNYYIKKGDFILVFVDGSKEVVPSNNGFYKADTVKWLDNLLTKFENKNIIIFQHFPIYDYSANSSQNLYKPEIYLDVLKKHKNVMAIYAGHYHINDERYVNGILNVTAPAAKSGSSEYLKIYVHKTKTNEYEIYNQVIKF